MKKKYYIEIAENEKKPDLKWHSFHIEKPKTDVPILFRTKYGTKDGGYRYYVDLFKKDYLVFGMLEWQYINEESYELSVEETDSVCEKKSRPIFHIIKKLSNFKKFVF